MGNIIKILKPYIPTISLQCTFLNLRCSESKVLASAWRRGEAPVLALHQQFVDRKGKGGMFWTKVFNLIINGEAN
jgi:hypothetical protein